MKRKATKLVMPILAVALFVAVLLWLAPSPVYCKKVFSERDHQVVMFSTRWCPYCKRARDFFTENQVRFCEYDVYEGSPNQSVYEELGEGIVPVILINDEVYHGFNQIVIRDALVEQELLTEQQE